MIFHIFHLLIIASIFLDLNYNHCLEVSHYFWCETMVWPIKHSKWVKEVISKDINLKRDIKDIPSHKNEWINLK